MLREAVKVAQSTEWKKKQVAQPTPEADEYYRHNERREKQKLT